MYLTFQALLLCFFLAQMANGQQEMMFSSRTQYLVATGQHLVGGAYPKHPMLVAASRYLFIQNGKLNQLMWALRKTPERYIG